MGHAYVLLQLVEGKEVNMGSLKEKSVLAKIRPEGDPTND